MKGVIIHGFLWKSKKNLQKRSEISKGKRERERKIDRASIQRSNTKIQSFKKYRKISNGLILA